MADTLELRILSQESVEFSDSVKYVSLPAVTGSMRVLPQHAPVIALLDEGDVMFMTVGGEQIFPVKGGVAELTDGKMTILI